jgi:hypothetical protein
MSSRDRRTVTRGVAAKIAAAGVLAVGAAVASAATAFADPAPPIPADPSDSGPPPGATLPNGLPVPLGPLTELGASGQDYFLSQTAIPAVPGSQPAAPASVDVLNAGLFLYPQNYKLAAPDEGNLYSIGPGPGVADATIVDSLKGAHALWHGGMGKLAPEDLGEPLPGTAPPPGTNIPAGLGFGLPDPGPPAPLRDPVPPGSFFAAPPPQPPPPSPYLPPAD